jgi:hypothetical protein
MRNQVCRDGLTDKIAPQPTDLPHGRVPFYFQLGGWIPQAVAQNSPELGGITRVPFEDQRRDDNAIDVASAQNDVVFKTV